MRKEIQELIEEWDLYTKKLLHTDANDYDADDRGKYCSLMAKTFSVLRVELQNDAVKKDICFLFSALTSFEESFDFCADPMYGVDDFHKCFMKALEKDFSYDEDGFLIVPNIYHDEEYDKTPEYHVNTTSFEGIEEQEVEWIPPEQDISRFETVDFGPYEWLVLKHSDGKTLLISKDAVNVQPFEIDKSKKEEEITYFNSSLREWINSSFLYEFSTEEQQKIVRIDLSGSDSNDEADAFFLLSKEEMLELMPIENERIVAETRFPEAHGAWWLRSTHYLLGIIYSADICSGTGHAGGGCNFFTGQLVRPAVWITSTSK